MQPTVDGIITVIWDIHLTGVIWDPWSIHGRLAASVRASDDIAMERSAALLNKD